MVKPVKFKNQVLIICITVIFCCSLLLAFNAHSFAQVEDVYAIKAGKIFTVTNDTLKNGIIILRNGIIEAVGQGLEIPVDAEIIEADSMWIYPGLIDSHTSLAIKKPKTSQPSSQTAQRQSSSRSSTPQEILNPEKYAADMLDPKDSKIKKMRDIGVTTVLTSPDQGIFRGHSALINLAGSKYGEMLLKSPVASHLTYSRNRGGYPSTLMGVIAFQRQTFHDAIYHKNLWARYNNQKQGFRRPVVNKSLDALLPILNKKMLVIISANTENEIKRSIKLAKEFGFNYLISGAIEGWRVIDHLKAEMKPVLVSLNYPKPENVTGYSYKLKIEGPKKEKKDKPEKKKDNDKKKETDPELAEIYANASKLQKAGLKLAFTSAGMKKPEELIKNINKAIEQGLSKEEALKALTINPAQIFGFSEQIGSIEEGKIANLVITSGDLFGEKTTVKYVFVDGKKFEMKAKKKKAATGDAKVDVTGTWEAIVETPQGEVPITLKLKQSGNELSGEFTSQMGSAEIYDGSVNGNEIQFSVEITIQGQTMELIFDGIVEGDSIDGSIDLGPMGSATWTATKPGF